MTKQDRLTNAKEWLATGDENLLPHVCLELRMCLEALVYEKLEFYRKYVPGVVFEKWQPTHALKMLTQFEPHADSSMRIAIAPESAPGVTSGPFRPIGEHKFFSTKWLNKNYNRLGNYLHTQHETKKKVAPEKLRASLDEIIKKIEDTLNSSIKGCSLAERVNFECQLCSTKCMANAEMVREKKIAMCINPNCRAEHFIEKTEAGYEVRLMETNFECLKCGEANFFANCEIKVGASFTCRSCKAEHLIGWGYNLRKNIESS